jgi:hypothetical protein
VRNCAALLPSAAIEISRHRACNPRSSQRNTQRSSHIDTQRNAEHASHVGTERYTKFEPNSVAQSFAERLAVGIATIIAE